MVLRSWSCSGAAFKFSGIGSPRCTDILRKAHALVGDVKENNRRAKYTVHVGELHIEDVGGLYKYENKHSATDGFHPQSYIEKPSKIQEFFYIW